MKKKDQYSKDDVSNLMKKLQATFLSDDQSEKNQRMDADDRAFRNKLASLLERLSRPPQKKKNDLPPIEEIDTEEEPSEEILEESQETTIPIEDSVPPASPAPGEKKARASKPKKERATTKKEKKPLKK